MREWFSAQELADRRLPTIPQTKSGIIRRAKEDSWQTRGREGRGGGREYYVGSLPDEARVALLMRERRGVVPAAPTTHHGDDAAREAELWAAYEQKSDKVKAEASRRVNALHAIEQLVRDGCQRLEAYTIVANQVGECESTIRNWCRVVKGESERLWAPLLMPKWVGRTKTADYDAEVYDLFRDLYLSPSRPPATVCYDRVCAIAKARRLTVPSYATLCRDLKRREDPAIVLLEREGERALAESFPYLERDRSGFYAMQALNADGHVLDLRVQWADGEIGRATLLAVQDLYSGTIVGYRLVKAESAFEMSLTFLETFDRYGVPDRLYLDNTLAAASKRMTAGAPGRKRFRDREGDPVGVLPLLGVRVTFVTPAHGQAKPIERSFRSIADLISKHPAFEGAYLGNNTQNKPANYGERIIAVEEELAPIVAQEIARFNAKANRRGGLANGQRSYQELFDASYAEHAHEIKRITANQRRLLYMVAERVTVDRRDGCIKLFKNRYWSEEVSRLKGTQVVVRYHPTESLHGSVWVYRLDGSIVGEAPIYSKAGFADAAAAETHTRARKQFVRRKKDLAKAKRRLDAVEVAALVPPLTAPDAPAAGARAVDFTLPTTPEQLGRQAVDRRAAGERVNSAIGKLADAVLMPRRKRA